MYPGVRLRVCLCPCECNNRVSETLDVFVGIGPISPAWGRWPVCLNCYEEIMATSGEEIVSGYWAYQSRENLEDRGVYASRETVALSQRKVAV